MVDIVGELLGNCIIHCFVREKTVVIQPEDPGQIEKYDRKVRQLLEFLNACSQVYPVMGYPTG